MNYLLLSIVLCALLAAWKRRGSEEASLFGFGKEETLPLRGLMAMIVVFSHLDTKTHFALHVLAVLHWATPAVAVFFFLSGYGLVKSHTAAESSGRLAGYWPAFWRRSLVRLMVPLLVVGAVWAVTRFFVLDLAPLAFLRRLPKYVLRPPFSWYVWAQLLFYLLFFLSFRFFGRGRRVPIVCLMVLAYFIVMKYAIGTIIFYWVTSMAFAVGVAFSENEDKVRSMVAKFPVRVYLAVAAAAAAFLAARKLGFWHVPVREAFYIVIGPSFALLLYAFDWLRHVRPLMVLGGVSYEIYLVHGVVLNNLLRFGWPPVILVVVVVSVTIILAVFLNIALRRRRKI